MAFQPLKILAFALLVLSFLGGLGSFFGFDLVPDLPAANPIYFLTAYAKYLLLSLVAFCIVVPREQRLHVLPIVPLYFFYALLQIVPISIGYANWLLLFPAFFLVSTLFALNFVGDGLRDALDPKDR